MDNSPEGQMIVKANRLVQAKMPLSKIEHRIVALLISQLDKDDESFGFQKLYIKDLKEVADISTENLYHRAERICSSLLEKKLEIKKMQDGKRMYKGISLIDVCEYKEGDGYIKAKFNDTMAPYLLQLKKRFTMYKAGHFVPLSSKHSMRVYELLKMREDVSVLRMTIDEFRDILGLEDSYKYFSQLKRSVVNKAQREIAEKTDIEFTYDVEREGRSPKRICFFIHSDEESSEGPQKIEDRTNAPQIDLIGMFKADLTQEELDNLSEETVQSLQEKAFERARRENPQRSENIVQMEAYRYIRRMYQNS